jgi:hypothetical protein
LLVRIRGAAVIARFKAGLIVLAVVVSAFAIYLSNRQTLASFDSAPNSLFVLNLFANHRLDFDLFRGSYFTALGGQYAFVEAPNGHLTSVFPIGPALVSLPLYAIFALAEHAGVHVPAITSPAFEPLRQQYEKTAAAALAALSVGLLLLCAREIGGPAQAATATVVYALATSIWTIGSQALWQHGPVNLFVLAMAYALFRANRAPDSTRCSRWLLAAGVCAGLLPVMRPTAVLLSLPGLIFAGWAFRRRSLAFVIGLALGAAPGVAWNAYFFHSLLGGYAYAGIASSYLASPYRALATLAALLVSPSRGLLTFSPVLAFSILGIVRASRVRDNDARLVVLLAAGCGAIVVQYAFFANSLVGFSYGPRYLTDIVGVAALLLVYVIPAHPLAGIRRRPGGVAAAAVFSLTFLYSVGVQFVGANAGAAGSEWSAVPISIDRRPNRVWPLADSQIERNARAAYVRFFAWDVARSPSYERALAAHVRALSPSLAHVAKGTSIEATAVLSNDGRSRVYGYDTGVYVGQLRVRVRIVDAHERTTSEQYLYVTGSPTPGEVAGAVGAITMPPAAGAYLLECRPALVGGGTIDDRAAPFRVILHVN